MSLSYTQPIVVGSLTYSDTIYYQAPPTSSVLDSVSDTSTTSSDSTSTSSDLVQTVDPSSVKLTDLTIDKVLWYAELPPGTVTPYAILSVSSVVPSAKTTGYTNFRSSFQLIIISSTRNDAVLRATIARRKFDKKTIYEDAGGKVQTQVGPVRSEIAVGLGLNGVDAWMARFNLDVFYNRV